MVRPLMFTVGPTLFLLLDFAINLNGEVLPFFNWDRTNTMFAKNYCGNGKHAHIFVNSYDRMNLVCPSAALPVSVVPETIPQDKLYENLWMVSKKEFDTCQVDAKRYAEGKSKLLMKCDEPSSSRLKFYQLSFKPESGSSAALIFKSNTTYYFIATSDGYISSLEKRSGGACTSHTMKLAITVCGERDCRKCPNLCCMKPTTSPPRPPVPTSSVGRSTKTARPPTATKRSTGKIQVETGSAKTEGVQNVNHVEDTPKPLLAMRNSPNEFRKRFSESQKNIARAHARKDNDQDKKERFRWDHFGYGAIASAFVVTLIILIVAFIVRRRQIEKRNKEGCRGHESNSSAEHYDRSDKRKQYSSESMQEPTFYKRLESTGSSGSGGDTPPSYPDSPNGTLDSNGHFVQMKAPIRNGPMRSSRQPLLSSNKNTCVQV